MAGRPRSDLAGLREAFQDRTFRDPMGKTCLRRVRSSGGLIAASLPNLNPNSPPKCEFLGHPTTRRFVERFVLDINCSPRNRTHSRAVAHVDCRQWVIGRAAVTPARLASECWGGAGEANRELIVAVPYRKRNTPRAADPDASNLRVSRDKKCSAPGRRSTITVMPRSRS